MRLIKKCTRVQLSVGLRLLLLRTRRQKRTLSPSGLVQGMSPSKRLDIEFPRSISFFTIDHSIFADKNRFDTQIPTVLYYDQYQKVVGWGPDIADALAPTGYPKPGVQKVILMKKTSIRITMLKNCLFRLSGSSYNS